MNGMKNAVSKVSFGIIGTNFISDWFVEASKQCEDTSISCVYSRSLETGSAFAKKHGIERVYTDYSEMLNDSGINAVYVASPMFCHCEHTLKALRAGKHVLCEKMIAADHSEISEMRNEAISRDLVLLEAMRQDFDPSSHLIKEYIKRLGHIRRVTLEYCQYSSRYDKFKEGCVLNAFDPSMKNSALADIGIYPLHSCISLFGLPEKISSYSVFLENGFEGAGVATLSYGDMIASVIYSKISQSVNPSVIEGEDGSLTIDKINDPQKIIYYPKGAEPTVLQCQKLENNMVYEIGAFCDMVNGKTDYLRYLDDSEKTMRCVDEIYKCSGISFGK